MKLEKANRHLNRAKNCNYCEKKKFCIRKKNSVFAIFLMKVGSR